MKPKIDSCLNLFKQKQSEFNNIDDQLLNKIGADVPACYYGKNCIATGIGDKINECIDFPKYYFVLVKPDMHLSTSDMYAKINSYFIFDQQRNYQISKLTSINEKDYGNDFEKIAKKISISNTALEGGNLGWVNENVISKKFKSKIINTPIGNISEPMILPEGIVFFKVRDARKSKQFTNLEDAKNKLVNFEKMKILRMYSKSYYENLKKSISIYYY